MMEEVRKAEIECLRKTLKEKKSENEIILDFINYILKNYSNELNEGFGKAVLEGQATFYEEMVKRENDNVFNI